MYIQYLQYNSNYSISKAVDCVILDSIATYKIEEKTYKSEVITKYKSEKNISFILATRIRSFS